MVDATPASGELFYGGGWHTWLVGGVGSAGQEIYALDISDPSSFSEANASSIVRGDWTPASTAGNPALSLNHLNCTVGTPTIARLHNGQWAIIFGNGLPDAKSNNCRQTAGTFTAGIYVGLIDPATGAVSSFKFIDTGIGTSASPNGIAYVGAADLDGDNVTDYVYAGDLRGNVWRFDLTSATPANWAVSTFGKATATPLFTTPGGQPITTTPIVAAMQTGVGTSPRMMVYFGTGQMAPATNLVGNTYATGTQSFYGIWDWDFSSTPWKGIFTNLAATPPAITTANLQSQQVVATGMSAGYRSLTANPVCWADISTCVNTKQYGWFVNFPDSSEQIIYNPTVISGAIVVSSAEPPVVNAQACNPGLQTGWTMAFNPATGGGFSQGFFKDANGNFASDTGVFGVNNNGVGTSIQVNNNGQTWLGGQTSSGSPSFQQVNPPTSPNRVSWRENKI
jgi:type IV pilus assembly protein PilY1